jgi:indoleamine 2,3-dioxygenase
MAASTPTFSFPIMDDTKPDDHSLPAFMVSTSRGFLPRGNPIVSLPAEFAILESLLQRMPIKKLDGTPGLLATFEFGDAVLKELLYRDDLVVMNALYRDYSFLASAYLFEPCHERHMRGEEYGLGRQSLPRCISLPIVKVAEL